MGILQCHKEDWVHLAEHGNLRLSRVEGPAKSWGSWGSFFALSPTSATTVIIFVPKIPGFDSKQRKHVSFYVTSCMVVFMFCLRFKFAFKNQIYWTLLIMLQIFHWKSKLHLKSFSELKIHFILQCIYLMFVTLDQLPNSLKSQLSIQQCKAYKNSAPPGLPWSLNVILIGWYSTQCLLTTGTTMVWPKCFLFSTKWLVSILEHVCWDISKNKKESWNLGRTWHPMLK